MPDREVLPLSRLEPYATDPPPFSGEPSEFRRRDEEAASAWPYSIPDLSLPDHTVRYLLGLYASPGPVFKEPSALHIWLCPPGIGPETHGVLAMGRRGVATVAYRRNLERQDLPEIAPRIRKGWRRPEYAYGGKFGKTNWTFVAHTTAPDGYQIEVIALDDPRRRDRSQVLSMLDRALEPFRVG